ncbi:MAG: helix-turn-helix domain-containing protein [Kofleriaceae bacterium]
MTKPIRDLPFRHGAKPQLGVEVFRLSELYARAERLQLDHGLETPQRPEFHTLYVGLRGRSHMIVDFLPVPLGAGVLSVVARGRVQYFVPERGVDAWLVLFEPTVIEHASRVLSPAWTPPVVTMPAADRRDLIALVEAMHAEQIRPLDRLQPAIMAAQLRLVLLRAERLLPDAIVQPPALEQFFTILERDYTTTREVAHYARAAALSARRLGELLVAHTGKSTKQVIDERVVLECKRLLVHTQLSVKELAARIGFAEPTNLVKFFRHHTGTTPQAFRETQRTFLPSRRGSSPRGRRADG